MTDSSGEYANPKPFATIDLDGADGDDIDLASLHARVLVHNGRVELRRRGGACVLISKDELDGLEKALEILSNTDTARLMRQEIATLASVASPRSAAAPTVEHAFLARGRSIRFP
jgi:hypothetical protein